MSDKINMTVDQIKEFYSIVIQNDTQDYYITGILFPALDQAVEMIGQLQKEVKKLKEGNC